MLKEHWSLIFFVVMVLAVLYYRNISRLPKPAEVREAHEKAERAAARRSRMMMPRAGPRRRPVRPAPAPAEAAAELSASREEAAPARPEPPPPVRVSVPVEEEAPPEAVEAPPEEGSAEEEGCRPRGGAIDITIETGMPEPQENYSLNEDEINQLREGGPPEDYRHAAGLTVGRPRVRYSHSYASAKTRGGVCFWVRTLKVKFFYEYMNVYVSNAYPRVSCEFDLILNHEHRHVEFEKRAYGDSLEMLRSDLDGLEGLPTPASPAFVASIDEGRRAAKETLGAYFDVLVEDHTRRRKALHATIDTPEAYAREWATCGR